MNNKTISFKNSFKNNQMFYNSWANGKHAIAFRYILESATTLLSSVQFTITNEGIAVYSCVGINTFSKGNGYGRIAIIQGFHAAMAHAVKEQLSPKWALVYYTLNSLDSVDIIEPVDNLLTKVGFSRGLEDDGLYKMELRILGQDFPGPRCLQKKGYWKMPMSKVLKLKE